MPRPRGKLSEERKEELRRMREERRKKELEKRIPPVPGPRRYYPAVLEAQRYLLSLFPEHEPYYWIRGEIWKAQTLTGDAIRKAEYDLVNTIIPIVCKAVSETEGEQQQFFMEAAVLLRAAMGAFDAGIFSEGSLWGYGFVSADPGWI